MFYRDWWRPGLPAWQRFPEARVPRPRGESFVTVQRFPSSRPEPGEPHLAPFFFDFDGDLGQVIAEVLALLGYLGDFQDLPVEATRLYYTGNKGIHVEVAEAALGVCQPSADLTYAYSRWARDLAGRLKLSTVDLGVYSARRMWRQVGSRHSRTGLYKVEVAPADLLRGPGHLRVLARSVRPALPYPEPAVSPVAAGTLRGYLEAYREERSTAAQGAASTCCADVPPCIERLLQRYWRGTGRSNRALMLLASWMYAAGVAEEEAVARAGRWFAGAPGALFASPPRDRLREAEKVVHCVYRSGGYGFACRFARALDLCSGAGAPGRPGSGGLARVTYGQFRIDSGAQ